MILVRLGEITVKSRRVRERFVRILLRNIGDALKSSGFRYKLRRERGRIFIYTDVAAVEPLRRVFGIKSLSVAEEVEFNGLRDLVEKAKEFFAEKVKGKRFAVRARRVGQHDFTSLDVERELGAALLEYAKGVDLESPEVTTYVEVRGSRAYLYTEVVRGYGGLPIGVEGKVVALVSGGFDSAVAAWYVLRRGAEVHYLFCNLGGFTHEAGVLSVLRVLAERWSYGYRPKLYVIDFKKILLEIRSKCRVELLNVLLKRYMLRAAERIAERIGAEAIVTGDSLGQVASQTLRNIYVSSLATKLPVLRPLIGFDKDDIVSMAREIGTYEASARVKEYCGAFAERPRTWTDPEEVEVEEEKLGLGILEEALRRVKEVDLKELTALPSIEDLEVDEPPPDSVVIDLRSREKFSRWHIPGSISIPFLELPERVGELDRSKTYVLVCDEGALSLEMAYILRSMGFKAFSLRGGVKRARRKLS